MESENNKKRKFEEVPDTSPLPTTTTTSTSTSTTTINNESSSSSNDDALNLSEVLANLKKHLLNEKKVVKALALFTTLTEAKLSSNNCLEFFNVLELFMSSLTESTLQIIPEENISSIIKIFHQHESYFPSQNQFQIHTWYLQYYISKILKITDDPYLFNKSCQYITSQFNDNFLIKKDIHHEHTHEQNHEQKLEADAAIPLPPNDPNDPFHFPETLKFSRLTTLLFCLKICYQIYLRAGWTKQPIESLYLHCTQKRLLIPFEEIRNQLDDLNTQLTHKQRKKLSVNGGQMQTIRTYNSSAHPLLTKKVGILR